MTVDQETGSSPGDAGTGSADTGTPEGPRPGTAPRHRVHAGLAPGRPAPGIVHVGVGGFHRAHQAVYLDELARHGHTDGGTVGVGLHSREIGEVLAAQDRL